MAWKISNIQTQGVVGDAAQVTIVCDAGTNKNALPTGYAPGSFAIVAESGMPVYMVDASGEWADVD